MMDDPVKSIQQALEVLGLPPMISQKELKERYRELSKRYHPDRGGSHEEMAQINRAYKILQNYMENYRFTFSDEEILKQFPLKEHQERFRF